MINHPSNGGPRYTIDTSVFPYTADTEGYKRLSGKPIKTRQKLSINQDNIADKKLTSKCDPQEFIISFKC